VLLDATGLCRAQLYSTVEVKGVCHREALEFSALQPVLTVGYNMNKSKFLSTILDYSKAPGPFTFPCYSDVQACAASKASSLLCCCTAVSTRLNEYFVHWYCEKMKGSKLYNINPALNQWCADAAGCTAHVTAPAHS
jgi:hypothetical protein